MSGIVLVVKHEGDQVRRRTVCRDCVPVVEQEGWTVEAVAKRPLDAVQEYE